MLVHHLLCRIRYTVWLKIFLLYNEQINVQEEYK